MLMINRKTEDLFSCFTYLIRLFILTHILANSFIRTNDSRDEKKGRLILATNKQNHSKIVSVLSVLRT